MGMEITIDLVKVSIFAGYSLVIFGILTLIAPRLLLNVNAWANKLLINLDDKSIAHRICSGIASLLLGTIILSVMFKFG
jgi:hypothetical protein